MKNLPNIDIIIPNYNKADYLIHPFSTVTNCTTKFNNEKPLYQYKKPDVPAINDETDFEVDGKKYDVTGDTKDEKK